MTDQRKITIAIPTWQRTMLTIESFIEVHDDDRVGEVVIVDDASDENTYKELADLCSPLEKVKLFRNENNLDCYRNKAEAVSKATNDWVILLDSDNSIDEKYLDVLYSIKSWQPEIIYTPSFAKPNFDFRPYEGLLLNHENIAAHIDRPMLEVCLNACNYFVNRESYLEVWDGTIDPVTSDSIFQVCNWIKDGGAIYIVPDLHYIHRVHNGSHYQNNVHRTPENFHNAILNTLRGMI